MSELLDEIALFFVGLSVAFHRNSQMVILRLSNKQRRQNNHMLYEMLQDLNSYL